MFFFPLNKKQLLVSFTIASICFVGDKNSENQRNGFAAAICDNLTHAFIGVFTWIGILSYKTFKVDTSSMFEITLCGICSSIIDVDHFIVAKSLSLKDATNLRNRPFLHSTTIAILIVTSVFLIACLTKINWLYKFGWILTAAFLSHHIRDSKRRGLWFWPFGSTPSMPFVVYIILQMFLPQILSASISQFSPFVLLRGESNSAVETV